MEREEIKKNLENISKKIENIPEEFWSKFIDAYKLLEKKEESPQQVKKRGSKNE